MRNKKVVILSTGGTIASKRNPETGLLTAGVLSGNELAEMCELPNGIDVEVHSVFQVPSNHMNFDMLITLKGKIESVLERIDVSGIVVTHGTDTLEETSYFLDLTIKDKRPVVITGSQRGPNVQGTDAFVNLKQSILVAASEKSLEFGTLVLFNEKIFSARYIKKKHASNVDGFTSFGYGFLGIVDQETIQFYQKPILYEKYNIEDKLPNVEIIKCSLGSDGKFIDYAVEKGAKGIIIEAPGRGHAPPTIVPSVKNAVKRNVKVVLTTSAEEGFIKPVYDFPGSAYDFKNNGVILGSDYDSKKARIKLAVLLSAREQNIDYFF